MNFVVPVSRIFRTASYLLMMGVFISAGNSQTTTQFAGTLGTPASGVILTGSAINPNTGQAVRYLWSADAANGLCRLDPDVDTQGFHAINPATCLKTAAGVVLSPGAVAFDQVTNDLYVSDATGKFGIFRLHFLPEGDTGNGLLDGAQQEVLGGSVSGGKLTGGCGIQLNSPSALALGPDGNLIVGFSRTGALMRILSPQTEPLPCGNVQSNIGSTLDQRKDFALAWLGHTLFGSDSRAAWNINNADQCFTPQNGFIACSTPAVGDFPSIPSPIAAATGQSSGNLDGTKLYLANTSGVFAFDPAVGTPQSIGGSGFSFINALAVDNAAPGGQVLYVGDDPSNGLTGGQGRWWQIASAPTAPAPPGIPVNVSASAGDSQATLSWTPISNGQSITSYTVRNVTASSGVTVPDVTVVPASGTKVPPATVTLSGLVDGTSYQFVVAANNTLGSSGFSAASNIVTPHALTVPGAPTGVVATTGNASALVAWTAPANNGGSAIVSYTVNVLLNGSATGATIVVPGNTTGANVSGLTNGSSYTFTVDATNSVGSSVQSAPSNSVTPQAPAVPAAPTGVSATAGNAQATISWVAPASNGGAAVTTYIVTAQVGGAAVSSLSVSGTTTSTVVTGLTNGTTYTFIVNASNQVGAGPASLPSNAVTPSAPAVPPTTTDIQVTGSAQNGGPAASGTDSFTWQIKNNQSSTANNVQFTNTLAPGMVFQTLSTSLGNCSPVTPGTAGATISCTLSSLAGGQTMVVTVNVTFTAAGSMAATAKASFNGTDTNPANNSATVVVGVR